MLEKKCSITANPHLGWYSDFCKGPSLNDVRSFSKILDSPLSDEVRFEYPPPSFVKIYEKNKGFNLLQKDFFSKFYGKLGYVDFFTSFTGEKATQNNFSSQNFSVKK